MTLRTRRYWMLVAILGAAAFIWSVPTIWMLSLSLQPNELLARTTSNTAMGLVPYPFTIDNYVNLLNLGMTPRWFLNSLIVATGMTVATLILSTTAGYALARIRFPGRTAVIVLILAGLMVPEQVVFIPLYTMFADWGLHNTHVSMILPRLAVPLGVFLMMQFFRAIPQEIEEAAQLDGAGRFAIFVRIMLPMSIPAITTLAIITFLYAWNDYLWPLVSAQRQEMYTITVGLGSIQENFAQTEGLGRLMASGMMASAPVILLFVIFQRFVVRGIAMGGAK
ncbi:carbohydrate ABC transporter permease [Halovulum sp. GXIMD14794]